MQKYYKFGTSTFTFFLGGSHMELQNILRELASINLSALKITTPSNQNDLKKAFIEAFSRGRFTNPLFTYSLDANETAAKRRLLTQLKDETDRAIDNIADSPERLAYCLLKSAIAKKLTLCDVSDSILRGDDTSTKVLIAKFYGKITDELLNVARDLASGKSIANPYLEQTMRIVSPERADFCIKTYTPEEMKEVFDYALDIYGLSKEWQAIVTNEPRYTSITVNANDERGRIIAIPATRKPENILKVIQLAAHEIETHVRHNANCYYLLYETCGSISLLNATTLECVALDSPYTEGLAKIADAITTKRCLGDESGAPHPWYVLAAQKAAEGNTFAQVAEYIYENCGRNPEECWKITTRTFRGCSDPSTPSGFANPNGIQYLDGYVRAIAHYNDPAVFNYGKFNQQNIQLFRETTGKDLGTIPPHLAYQDFVPLLLNQFCN